MKLHLIAAAFWLLLGVALLALLREHPEARGLRLGGDGIPIGAVALAFAAYNLVRWWLGRRATPRAELTRRPVREGREPPERRPEFDFSRPEPPEAPHG